MNDIIRPPRRPEQPARPERQPPASPAPTPANTPVESVARPPFPNPELPEGSPKKPRSGKKTIIIACAAMFGLLIIAVVGALWWYQSANRPLSAEDKNLKRVQVVEGSSPSQIGQLLEEEKIIRSKLAFDIYTRLEGSRNKLQAGTYRLSPSESLGDIVKHLVNGNVDEFTLTFYPGATLTDKTETPDNKKLDVQTVLRRAGFSDDEIREAFKKHYDSPLFASKPASADFEGYVYGETYNFASSASVEQILERTFEEFYTVLVKNDLIDGFKKQGLTLYQGITLASIIQREVPDAADQKQVAQVFLKRLREGMQLGSDITAYYGADKEGLKRSVATDTVYNTRIHTGLPPGPIAAPGLTALEAVAHPAKGDYLYFLSGDDEVTYFARTQQEHEANIRNHCKIKCSIE